MSRYFYLGLLILAVGIIALLVYRTEFMPARPAVIGEFGGVSLRIEYATTEAERERGLGGRESVAPDYGMLFVFPSDGYYGFWMKDTLVPLDMFWLDAKGQVVSVELNVATSTYPNVFYPSISARYVLETAAGFAWAHSIGIGTPLILKNLPSVSK